MSSFDGRTSFFLFAMPLGMKKLSFGRTADEAYANLKARLTEQEMAQVDRKDFVQCKQEEYRDYLGVLA